MNMATQFAPSMFNTRSKKDNYYTPINVAIYSRVSTEHDEQLSAFDNQMDWYSLLLSTHPNWNVVEIYSDKASGTNTKRRKDFRASPSRKAYQYKKEGTSCPPISSFTLLYTKGKLHILCCINLVCALYVASPAVNTAHTSDCTVNTKHSSSCRWQFFLMSCIFQLACCIRQT